MCPGEALARVDPAHIPPVWGGSAPLTPHGPCTGSPWRQERASQHSTAATAFGGDSIQMAGPSAPTEQVGPPQCWP